MILYHGTDWDSAASIMVDGPQMIQRRFEGADFGQGFYTSINPQVAIERARYKAWMNYSNPAVVSFLVPNNLIESYEDQTHVKVFKTAGLAWAQFVVNCRAGYRYISNLPQPLQDSNISLKYHICKGEIADGDVKDIAEEHSRSGLPVTLADLDNIRSKEYSLQYSFHNEKALAFLSERRFNEVKKGGLHYVNEW